MSYLLYVAAFGEPRAHPRDLPSTPQNSRQVGPIGAPRTPRGSKVQRTAKTQTLDSCTPSPLIARRWTNVGAVSARRVLYTSRKTYARFTTRRVVYTMHTQDPPARPPRAPKDRQGGHWMPQKSTQRPPPTGPQGAPLAPRGGPARSQERSKDYQGSLETPQEI